jgi:hypothetical protein
MTLPREKINYLKIWGGEQISFVSPDKLMRELVIGKIEIC